MLTGLRHKSMTWGSTAREQRQPLRCDDLLSDASFSLDRAIDIAASPAVTFRWLCQLRVAPYSYDLLDNFGRRSPRELIPGLDELECGQRFMTIFRLVDFEPDRSITLRSTGIFGSVAVTYALTAITAQASRLHVRVKWTAPHVPVIDSIFRALAPPGDFVMMRKQLLTLKALAERT